MTETITSLQPPLANMRVSSPFGWRTDPLTHRTKFHQGLDLVARMGTPILAAGPGRVVAAGDSHDGYGNKVVIDHGGGLTTTYNHLSRLDVKPGDQVSVGETIARAGSTGRSTGPHLHFEVREAGVRRNPLPYLQRSRTQDRQPPVESSRGIDNAADRVLDRKGQEKHKGARTYTGLTYAIERQGDTLTIGRQGQEILKRQGEKTLHNAVQSADVTSLVGAAYQLDWSKKPRHPAYRTNGRMNPDLKGIFTSNTAATYLERFAPVADRNGIQSYTGSHYDFKRQAEQLSVFAKDGRGEILRVEQGHIQKNLVTDQDVRILVKAEHKLRLDGVRKGSLQAMLFGKPAIAR